MGDTLVPDEEIEWHRLEFQRLAEELATLEKLSKDLDMLSLDAYLDKEIAATREKH